jgi:hypothetical protein
MLPVSLSEEFFPAIDPPQKRRPEERATPPVANTWITPAKGALWAPSAVK